MSMEITLAHKVAVVTGASSGIGLAVVRQFLECDAAGVVCVFRRHTDPPELIECKREFGDKLQIVRGDVADEQTAIAYTDAALKSFGRLDILVANAAVSIVKAIH